MYYCINKDNHIEGYSEEYVAMEDCITIEQDNIDTSKTYAYVYENGKLSYSQELYDKVTDESEIVQLRTRREEECFSIINRGEAWYSLNVNTEERKQEFNKWYQAWLNVTQTRVTPERPAWIH